MLNIKILKPIANGFQGTVYTANYNGEVCIAKVCKGGTDNMFAKNEIAFAQAINSVQSKSHLPFMKMLSYMYSTNCKCQNIDDKMCRYNQKCKDDIAARNVLDTCTIILYSPVCDISLSDVLIHDTLTSIQFKKMMQQILFGIHIMHKKGYWHNDLTTSNIMRKDNKWYIIDYGSSIHIDDIVQNRLPVIDDLLYFLMHLVMTMYKKHLTILGKKYSWTDPMQSYNSNIHNTHLPKNIVEYISDKRVNILLDIQTRTIERQKYINANFLWILQTVVLLINPPLLDGAMKIPCKDVILYCVKNIYKKNVLANALAMLE